MTKGWSISWKKRGPRLLPRCLGPELPPERSARGADGDPNGGCRRPGPGRQVEKVAALASSEQSDPKTPRYDRDAVRGPLLLTQPGRRERGTVVEDDLRSHGCRALDLRDEPTGGLERS